MPASRSQASRRHGVRKSRQSASVQPARRSRSTGSPSSSVARRRSARRSPSRGASSCVSIHRSNARRYSASAAGSVRTTKRGSTSASTGRSCRRSLQKPWMVLRRASSRCATASSRLARRAEPAAANCRARSSSARSRSFSSPAAFSVNVTATTVCTLPRPSASTATSRSTSSLVLPVPAAASTTIVSSSEPRMRSRVVVIDQPGHGQLRSLLRSSRARASFTARCAALRPLPHTAVKSHMAQALWRGAGGRNPPRDGAVDQLDDLEPAEAVGLGHGDDGENCGCVQY